MNQIFLYHIQDYIRVNKTGVLDLVKMKESIQEIGRQAQQFPGHDILIDSRKVHLDNDVHDRVLEILVELVVILLQDFNGKIANMISSDPRRVAFARKLELGVQEVGIQYRIFFDHEAAMDWLSERQNLRLEDGDAKEV